jgi:subtilisin family serine protease
MTAFRTKGKALGAAALLAGVLLGLAPAPADGPPADKDKDKDLRAKQQPLLDKLGVRQAWEVTRGDPKVLVGVIDNGFDFFHPDLKGQLVPGYYYPAGYHGEFYENLAHGTTVASLIVARGDGPGGMVGLAPRCRVLTASQGMIEHTLVKMQSQFFRDHAGATLADWQKEMMKHPLQVAKFGVDWVHYQVAGAADAVRYLVDHGARVINISGGLKKSLCPSAADWRRLEEAFAYAADKGVVIVLAAGNNAARWEDYPGRAETVIVAGAVRLDDRRWEEEVEYKGGKIKQGSNYGARLTVMAPVENLVVCVPHERRFYECDDGPMGQTKVPFKGPHDVLRIGATSSAAPVVTSLVALVRSVRPDLNAKAVVEVIRAGSDRLGEKGHDLYTGYGRVNFARTIKLAQGWGR